MKTALDILREHRIPVPRRGVPAFGQFYTTCPVCSPSRKKKHALCLSVKIDHEGVRWFCNHCPNADGAFYDGRGAKPSARDEKPVRRKLADYYR